MTMNHSPQRVFRLNFRWLVIGLACGLLATASPTLADSPTPIMPLDEVRVGMKGYGKTVFHGDTIEPFAFHVVSVISDSSANRATIWVECTDPRMQQSGPVQGMSGSPMYLWEDTADSPNPPRELGEGGRLIGAFAFGYPDVNVCLVGVQPIEYMREVGDRAVVEPLEAPQARRFDRARSRATLSLLQAASRQDPGLQSQATQIDAIHHLLFGTTNSVGENATPPAHLSKTSTPAPTANGGGFNPGQVVPLRLPLTVGDAQTAQVLGPMLASSGIQVMAGDLTSVAGKPPSNVDPQRVKLEPGSVLSIPLAFGDVDFNAAGTVTDVLPDGTVLGFGHAMDAVGSSRLPMANGYTHFVVSRDSISFKRGSSLDIVGSIVRDEASAVAGVPDVAFFAAPVQVQVKLPAQPTRTYNYHVVDHPQITPAILAAVTNASLTAVQGPPAFHTLHLKAEVKFSGGRTLSFDRVIPGSGMNGLLFEMLPSINAMMQNPFEPLRTESATISLDIVDGIDQAELVSATLDRPVVQPGDTVQLTVRLEPYDAPETTRTFAFKIPSDLPEGEHQLMVSDYNGHLNRLISGDPRFQDLYEIDQLVQAMQLLNDADEQAVYIALARPRPGITVGRQGFDHLPGSRAVLMSSAASSAMSLRPVFVQQQYPVGHVVVGDVALTLNVQHAAP